MKQVLQHLRTGQIELADVPCPAVRPGHLLIQTTRTLISAGTERMLVEFGQASLLAKARAQPDKVKQVLAKIRTDGLLPTIEAVFTRLDEPLPLGYCNVGRVIEVGAGVEGFSRGDLVASNGPHAEMVCVPATLAARVPEGVGDDEASFTVLGSIALHGVRLLGPQLGETCVVIGLGLLGMVAAQLLRAHGCHVLGVDVNPARCELVRDFGCQTACISAGADPIEAARAFSRGYGVDGVLICASSKDDAIIHQAAQMCRKRGKLVIVGVVGMNLMRADFYERELSLQVSCSYGPGRYDPEYEAKGRDYPRPYVRWTVARNFEAVLDAIAQKHLNVAPLISRRVPHAEAARAYDMLLHDSSALGIVMDYPPQPPPTQRVVRIAKSPESRSGGVTPVVGVLGAGAYSKLFLLPAVKKAGARIKVVASSGGATAFHAGRKVGADEAASDLDSLLTDPEINAVFIATRHSSHAPQIVRALEAGKHVFCEKPLAVNEEQLDAVRAAHARHPHLQLMVGFNRRFAPHAIRARELLSGRSQPIAIDMLVNAGELPAEHWQQDAEQGGGRIIGEGCHFIDLALFLIGRPIATVSAVMFGPQAGRAREDKMTIAMSFADGSIATVHYWANGPRAYPKETVTIFSERRVLAINNWRSLSSYEWRGAPRMNIRADKGHYAEFEAFVERVRTGGAQLIPFAEQDMVTLARFAAVRAAREHPTIRLAGDDWPSPAPCGPQSQDR